MAAGSGRDRFEVEDRTAADYFLDTRRGSDEIDPSSIHALGSQPVPLQPPSILRSSMLPAITAGRNLWPVIAILGCVIAVLVAVLIVLAGRPPRRAIAVEPAASAAAASAAEQARIERVRRPSEAYQAAIRSHERALHRCATERAESFPVDAEAVIVVGVDGRARQVTLRPDGAESSEIGACIRRVLHGVTFPRAPDEKEVAVGLAVYR
jgi:hypothetical protein